MWIAKYSDIIFCSGPRSLPRLGGERRMTAARGRRYSSACHCILQSSLAKEASMSSIDRAKVSYDKQIAALLVIDPYNDFHF